MSETVTLSLAGPADIVRAEVIALLGLDPVVRKSQGADTLDEGLDLAQDKINDLVGDLKEARFLFREKEKELEKVIEHRDSLIEGIKVIEAGYQDQVAELNVKVEALTAQNALLTSTLEMARADLERLQTAAEKPKRDRKPRPEAALPASEARPDPLAAKPVNPVAPAGPVDVRAFVIGFLEEHPETTWGQIIEARDATVAIVQVETVLQQLRDEGLIEPGKNDWDSPVRLVRTGQNKAPSLPDEAPAPPSEDQEPARSTSATAAPPENIPDRSTWEALPQPTLAPGIAVFALLMDETIRPGVIEKHFPGSTCLRAKVQGKGTILLDVAKIRAKPPPGKHTRRVAPTGRRGRHSTLLGGLPHGHGSPVRHRPGRSGLCPAGMADRSARWEATAHQGLAQERDD